MELIVFVSILEHLAAASCILYCTCDVSWRSVNCRSLQQDPCLLSPSLNTGYIRMLCILLSQRLSESRVYSRCCSIHVATAEDAAGLAMPYHTAGSQHLEHATSFTVRVGGCGDHGFLLFVSFCPSPHSQLLPATNRDCHICSTG